MSRKEAEIIIKRKIGVVDPAGMVIKDILIRLGFAGIDRVTTGKYFLVSTEGYESVQIAQIAQFVIDREVGHPSINESWVNVREIKE